MTLEEQIVSAVAGAVADKNARWPRRCVMRRAEYNRLCDEVVGLRREPGYHELSLYVATGRLRIDIGDPGDAPFKLMSDLPPTLDPDDMLHL